MSDNMRNDLWEPVRKQEVLERLRTKWRQAKKNGDTVLMGVVERQAKALSMHT